MFGHTHNEAFNVVKSIKSDKNIGINFIGGSVTPYTDKHPSFTVVEFDQETLIPVNFKTYFMNLTKANEQDKMEWELFHDFKQTYGIDDVSPDSLYSLAEKFKTDEAMAVEFTWNEGRKAGPKPSCNEQCRTSLYCTVTSSEIF